MQNHTLTENGAVARRTTESDVLDFYAQAGALRNREELDIFNNFMAAYHEDKLLALKALFHTRDVRGGLGERRTFRIILKGLAQYDPQAVRVNLPLIAQFGRWDDLLELLDTSLQSDVVEIIKDQLQKDWQSENPSLLAKWLPSENSGLTKAKAVKGVKRKLNDPKTTESEKFALERKLANISIQGAVQSESNKLAKKLMTLLGMKPPYYRKVLSGIRKKIQLVETKMSEKDWGSIPYGNLPSKAGLLYRKAFLRHDEERYNAYLESLTEGAKVNSKTLYPYELISKIMNNQGRFVYGQEEFYPLYNAMWEQMADFTAEDFGDSLAVVDTSDSMTWEQNAQAMKVALSMGLYFAENNKGNFRNHIMSFSSAPQLVEIKGDNFVDKVNSMLKQTQYMTGGNTDIEATFDLILSVAKNLKLPQSELPKRVVIISDMEFDQARGAKSFSYFHNNDLQMKVSEVSLLTTISDKFTQAGYEMPRLVFWNVNARNDQFPMTMSDTGVQFVSGYSTNVLKALVAGKEELSAYELMLDVLSDERYNSVTAP